MLKHFISLAQRPENIDRTMQLADITWPIFLTKEPIASENWRWMLTNLGDFHFAGLDENEHVIAAGHTIPFRWDGTLATLPDGFSAVIQKGLTDQKDGVVPNALSALSAVVAQDYRGQGLSSKIINQMRTLAQTHNLRTLVAPVRPTLKTRYPLTPMANYIQWKTPDGAPFDPWIRVHWKLGAKILGVATESMVIEGSVAEWEEWAGMRFPDSGDYVVPGALNPISIDCETDTGRYVEPNVWMEHAV